MYVTRPYVMDPETEDLIFGVSLVDGAVVLAQRAPYAKDPNDETLNKVHNRWCTVTQSFVYMNEMHFIGVYEDGMREIRSSGMASAWYIKKDRQPKLFMRPPTRIRAYPQATDWTQQNLDPNVWEREGDPYTDKGHAAQNLVGSNSQENCQDLTEHARRIRQEMVDKAMTDGLFIDPETQS
jgi:hypothetical protein